jgi:hypothetical protein
MRKEELYHYGVRGMKWRKRKKSSWSIVPEEMEIYGGDGSIDYDPSWNYVDRKKRRQELMRAKYKQFMYYNKDAPKLISGSVKEPKKEQKLSTAGPSATIGTRTSRRKPINNGQLVHSGVKGMKWGVWNEETKERYLGFKGNKKASIRIPSEETTKNALNQTVKGGKDKPNISPAEKFTKDVGRITTESGNVATNLENIKRRKIQKAIDEETERELRGMTDQQVRERINRMNLERQYSQLKYGDIETGYESAKEIIETVGSVVGVASGVAAIASTVYMIKHPKS